MRLEAARQALIDLKEEISRRLRAINDDLSARPDSDIEDRATQLENEGVLVAMRDEGAAQIVAIDAALARIELGLFGKCVKCHEPIAGHRLATLPYTPFCARCARMIDQGRD